MDPNGSSGPPKIHHLALKAVGGLFGLIIAPIIVVLAANLLQKKIDQPAPEPAKSVEAVKEEINDAPPAKTADAEAKHKGVRKGLAKAHSAKKQGPTTVRLLGRDLTGFHTFYTSGEEGAEPVTK